MQGQRKLTEDGYEESWQVNALSPFLLTRLLLPNLRTASKVSLGSPSCVPTTLVLRSSSHMEPTCLLCEHGDALEEWALEHVSRSPHCLLYTC